MSTSPAAIAQLAADCQPDGLTQKNSEKIAAELAKTFGVQQEEVGLLRLEKESLVFVHPVKLHNVGRIPLNSSSVVAVRTVNSRRPEIINNFVRARHATFFEMVDVGSNPGQKKAKEEQVIQKLMSAPVISMNKVLGVIQICRKGLTGPAAGPDFSQTDLQKLAAARAGLAKCFEK